MLAESSVRIDRAGAMLHYIVGFVRRSWYLIELLRHWRGMDIPVELESVIEEARSKPKPRFAELQEQLVFPNVQRILAKYGLLKAAQRIRHTTRDHAHDFSRGGGRPVDQGGLDGLQTSTFLVQMKVGCPRLRAGRSILWCRQSGTSSK